MEPFASLAGSVRSSVPRLLINRDSVGPFTWGSLRPTDVTQLGDVVTGVGALAQAIGWTQELEALMAQGATKVSYSQFFLSRTDIVFFHIFFTIGDRDMSILLY